MAYLDELCKSLGSKCEAISKAQQAAAEALERIKLAIKPTSPEEGRYDSTDLSIVVFGSLARGEWTSGSDLDWTLLVDGEADYQHAQTAHQLTHAFKNAHFKMPGRTNIFGNMSFSHNIIHQIGGEDDSNRNTTQRLLLLLESFAVGDRAAHRRVITGIISRYLKTDFTQFRCKVPRFLCNDVKRFWNTMCVDYAHKMRDREGEGWGLRNTKLRMSRKLLFVSGLLTCFTCAPELLTDINPDLVREPTVDGMAEHLASYAEKQPLEILSEVVKRYGKGNTAADILTSYNDFLIRLDNDVIRKKLDLLAPENAAVDADFKELKEIAQCFQNALLKLFFQDEPRIARLSQEYGVF
jgi:hypothetical protein